MAIKSNVGKPKKPLKIRAFKSSAAFRDWLDTNHAGTDGIWLRIFKKDSGEKSVTYAEALDQSLCFGWIDGLKRPYDKRSWLQKFTPRRPKSRWSKINTGHAERLIKSRQMAQAGFAAISLAKADGRWDAAYDSPGKAAPPQDFLEALERDQNAKAFFGTLNRVNVYSIVYRLQTATKPETRVKRFNAILGMLARGEKFHP
jgi:uncharacterized protein YdeI (YjbR/CyaY-like superfamily)